MNPAAWRRAAVTLAAAIPRERLHPAVLAWTDTDAAASRWAIAVSGGADSLSLLLLVWAHWPARRGRLVALHFNHRLRGRAAAGDERFCRSVCAALGIRFVAGRWERPPGRASETEARAARHAFFRLQLGRARARALWLGHQQDDIAETQLMRLARGSGSAGLSAPRPVQLLGEGRVNLRPLLAVKKSELAAALRAGRVPWREDASNASAAHVRNRMRHRVLPAWSRAMGDRDVLAGAALARELLDEDAAALDAWADAAAVFDVRGALPLRRVRGLPRAVVRRVLHRWLDRQPRGCNVSRQAFVALLDDLVIARPTRHSLGVGVFAVIGQRDLRLENARGKLSR